MEETMLDYIKESGNLVRINTSNSQGLTKDIVNEFTSNEYNRILIIASGSSYHGAYGAKLFMEMVLKVKVDLVSSFTFEYYETIFDKKTFVIGAGQSGRSKNTNDALQKAKDNGLKTIGLSGNVDSVMKNHCDVICNWGMGIEKIGFVTKGVATLTAFLDLFAIESSLKLGIIDTESYNKYKNELIQVSYKMDEMYDVALNWYATNEEELTDLKRVQITGYGTGYTAALEGALKIAETTGHAATGYEMEEFLHGPSIETNEDRTVIIIDSGGKPSNRALDIFNGIHCLTNRVFMLTSRKLEDKRVCSISESVPEYFCSLVYCIPFQIIASKDRDKWTNPNDEARGKMNDILGYKSPKTGKELGL